MTETSDGDADGTRIIDGEAVAADVRDDVAAHVETLEEEGVTPGLATVLMSDDPASETYVSMKQRDCEEVGIESVHVGSTPTRRPRSCTRPSTTSTSARTCTGF